ncbi:hypothetical protein DAPPUDRAFT_113810 [Daphnia pulex]|uniref:Uncharacterized protein n=1 Tax=Daphnia pulex TaxID=6669 RepID=E9HG65_DAPPU|nr:hypothetical protein DAPPUDRAFT_113810 [Daphnia pulex]|eukprot:EFX69258.1 hypothetical protein DAPPUDRAFT_113810 [Daphnia pulex]
MSRPSDYYGGRYSWDPWAVNRVRNQENRDFDPGFEEWDRLPRGPYDEFVFVERDRAPFWAQHGAGPSFHVQPRDHFKYRERLPSVRFDAQQHDERYEDRYYQDGEFWEFLNRQGGFDEEIHENQVEKPGTDRLGKPRAGWGEKSKMVEKPRTKRVDQRKKNRKSIEEEEVIEVEEDVSDEEESEQEEAESPKRRPTDRSWLPKSLQNKKRKVKAGLGRPMHAVPNRLVPRVAPKPTFVSQEITEEISNWIVHGLWAEDSKAISKRFEFEFEDKSFSIKPPKLDSFMSRRAKDSNRSKTIGAVEEALIATQLKIMDIAPPLISSYTPRSVLSAKGKWKMKLKVWHRRSGGNGKEPFLTFLSGEGVRWWRAYVPGKEAEDLLFTDAFLQSMLKDATQDVTLANSAAAKEKVRAGIRKTNRPYPSTRVLRPIRSEAPGYFPEERRRSDKRKEHTTPANTWLRGGGRNVSFISCNTLKSSVNCKEGNVRVGEQILDFASNWSKVTDDVWVDCVTS